VRFFVAGDKKTPKAALDFVVNIDNAQHYYHGGGNWKCSEAIGFDTLARRNIAFLEALKWGADVIYSWDDDNLPVNRTHFDHIEFRFDSLFSGLKIAGDDNWFDPGFLLVPRTKHRGFPHDKSRMVTMEHVVDARIGVAAGLVIGDPDISAATRMELAPDIQSVSVVGHSGVVVDRNTRTVFNSQNTSVIRELMPSWFMAPGCQRFDDIYASLIVQRVMRERDMHVHFGPPFCYQERNKHDLLVDLRAEIDGMSHILKMAELLDNIVLVGNSVIDDTRLIYRALAKAEWYPKQGAAAAIAWLEDCENIF
jgi:hypothetical protein